MHRRLRLVSLLLLVGPLAACSPLPGGRAGVTTGTESGVDVVYVPCTEDVTSVVVTIHREPSSEDLAAGLDRVEVFRQERRVESGVTRIPVDAVLEVDERYHLAFEDTARSIFPQPFRLDDVRGGEVWDGHAQTDVDGLRDDCRPFLQRVIPTVALNIGAAFAAAVVVGLLLGWLIVALSPRRPPTGWR